MSDQENSGIIAPPQFNNQNAPLPAAGNANSGNLPAP